MLIALSAIVLAACASTPDSYLRHFDPRNEHNYLRIEVTGSRIPRYVDLNNHYVATAYPLKIVTRADIHNSMASDVCSIVSGGC